MPSGKELKWSQLRVGLLVAGSLATLTIVIFLLSNSTGGLFTPKLKLRVYLKNAAGIKVGAPVSLEGVTIGNVTGVRIAPMRNPTPVEVIVTVGSQYLSSLHTDSTVTIDQAGVLGDSFLDIDSTKARGPQPGNDAELPVIDKPSIEDVVRSSEGTIQQVNQILAKADQVIAVLSTDKGTIGKLINDASLYNKMLSTVNQLNAVSESIAQGKGTLGKLLMNEQMYDKADTAVDKLSHVANQLNSGQGTLGKLIQDPTLYNNLNAAVSNGNRLLADINAGKGSIGRLAKDPTFAQKLEDSVTRLDDMLKAVNEGQGTIGQLVVNKSLYEHTDQTMQEATKLVSTIRQDPKKYLTIHMRIF